MAYIRQIDRNEATGIIERVYSAAESRASSVANIIRVMSLDGVSANGSMGLYGSLMKTKNSLAAARREMLAAVVSNVNDCFY
jgi:hypothetical protein